MYEMLREIEAGSGWQAGYQLFCWWVTDVAAIDLPGILFSKSSTRPSALSILCKIPRQCGRAKLRDMMILRSPSAVVDVEAEKDVVSTLSPMQTIYLLRHRPLRVSCKKLSRNHFFFTMH